MATSPAPLVLPLLPQKPARIFTPEVVTIMMQWLATLAATKEKSVSLQNWAATCLDDDAVEMPGPPRLLMTSAALAMGAPETDGDTVGDGDTELVDDGT